MRKRILPILAVLAVGACFTSCMDDNEENYDDWKLQNDEYIANIDTKEYEKVTPEWAPLSSVYIKWHNDRTLTANSLVAKSNSTVNIKYEVRDIEGTLLDSSYARTDSVYQSTPSSNIIGMWIAMTTMHVGDSATVVMPWSVGYGVAGKNDIKPYSDLIFHMKVKSIEAFERPTE
ncbi:MAG: FKBP-type peptidyl-prolyl cis-trans isomerase [Muribaculaceae bacterium]|nr:FKBP-type peptidyl-prolyl cis-trans isomerase [Muribaculaceae bacterium]